MLQVRGHVDKWPFVGPFHNKPIVFFESVNQKTVVFSEGKFFVTFWETGLKRTTREFNSEEEALEFMLSEA